jgi:hypothetical protein
MADELGRDDAHMRDARGLAAVTRENRLHVAQLVAEQVRRPALEFSRL